MSTTKSIYGTYSLICFSHSECEHPRGLSCQRRAPLDFAATVGHQQPDIAPCPIVCCQHSGAIRPGFGAHELPAVCRDRR
ncbi:hypothetical protein AHF37_10344 [Paragonimus kellicotti]|nr:hypothetical protein AHF37_10344 [Paragonimus kellicotti]